MSIKIDLGCGGSKREGFIGLDYVAAPGVDHVLDLTNDRYPFDDDSVDHVFSSHFLEHIAAPNHVFMEIGRICRDGGTIEFWTPYAFSNGGLMYGHVTFLTEGQWMYFCYYHRDVHFDMLRGRWLLKNINYVVAPETVGELAAHNTAVDFAVRHYNNVVLEFGVEIEFRRDREVPPIMPARTYSSTRDGERISLAPTALV
jgi:SAM-dependent methyltransferase